MKIQKCHDCGIKEGELHLDGCDMEHCAKCGAQVLVDGRCDDTKVEPYFVTCLNCERCGVSFPEFKMVDDKEWVYICGVTYNKKCILCPECMIFIKNKRNKLKTKRFK